MISRENNEGPSLNFYEKREKKLSKMYFFGNGNYFSLNEIKTLQEPCNVPLKDDFQLRFFHDAEFSNHAHLARYQIVQDITFFC